MRTFVIARLTFHEAYRRWIVWAAIALGVLFLVIFGLGFNEIYKDIIRQGVGSNSRLERNEIFNFFTMAGLYAVNFLTVVMAVLTSVDTLSGEIASGTVQTLVSKPLRRWEIFAGKWLGFIIMLTLYLILMAGGVLLVVQIISGYMPPNFINGIGLMWLNIALLLTVSLAGGAYLSTLANGVLVFGLFGVAFIGGWVEQFGAFLENPTAINIGVISSLIIPSEAIWKRAVYEMQSPLVAALGFSPFSSTSVPSPLMIVYAVGYLLVGFWLGTRKFTGRDL